MKPELLDSFFDRRWKCFAFDDGASCVLLSRDNTCVQVRADLLSKAPPLDGSTHLREYTAGLTK